MKVENGVLVKVEPSDIENGSFYSWVGITKIGIYAFEDCISLEQLVLSMRITKIGIEAFFNCISLEAIYIPSCDEATRARIIDLLPEKLHSKVVAAGLLEKILSIRDTQLQRIVGTPHTNPMGRSVKSGMPFPDDILNVINGFLGNDNRFVSKARSQIEALALPANDKELSDYEQKIQVIVDEAIVRSKRILAQPVMPEVLDHLERLEEKASYLTEQGELKAARALQDLCTEIKPHHNALVSARLDAYAFQEKCKQAIEQKREILGEHRGAKSILNPVQNFLKSDSAFFKTNTIKLLDALIEAIKKETPKQCSSQSSR